MSRTKYTLSIGIILLVLVTLVSSQANNTTTATNTTQPNPVETVSNKSQTTKEEKPSEVIAESMSGTGGLTILTIPQLVSAVSKCKAFAAVICPGFQPDENIERLSRIMKKVDPNYCLFLVNGGMQAPKDTPIQSTVCTVKVGGLEFAQTDEVQTVFEKVHDTIVEKVFVATRIENQKELEELYNLHRMLSIFVGKPEDEDDIALFFRVSSRIPTFRFAYSTAPSVVSSLCQHPRCLVIRNKATSQIERYLETWTPENLLSYHERVSNPILQNFDRDDSPSTTIGREIPCLFLFGEDAGSEKHKKFEDVAKELRNEILFIYAEISNGISQRLIQYLRIGGGDIGYGVWLLKAKYGQISKYRYPYEDITTKQVREFIKDFDDGKIKPYYHSEQPPIKNDDLVKVAVGKTFKELVIDNDLNVLVDFYGLYCGHCVQFAPIYEEIAKRLSTNANIRLVKIEMSQNEVEGVNIYQYPTIMFYPAGSKNQPVLFQETRTPENIINFIKNYVQGLDSQDI